MAEPTSPNVSADIAAGSGAVAASSASPRPASAAGPVRFPGSSATSGSGSGGLVPSEWPAQAADAIVETVGKVSDKTTKPAITAARGAVYGMLAGIVGLVALVLLLILVVRLYSNYVPGDVWPLYAGLFGVLSIAGIVLLRRANRPAPSA